MDCANQDGETAAQWAASSAPFAELRHVLDSRIVKSCYHNGWTCRHAAEGKRLGQAAAIALRASAWLVVVGAALFVAGPAAAEDAAADLAPVDEWSLNISPYIWGSGLEGSIASFPGAPAAEVDVAFKDILKNLDLAGMAIVELRHRRVAAYMDLIYTSISAGQDTPLGILYDDVALQNEVFIGTFGGAYRALQLERASLDLLAGIRVWSVDTVLELEGGILPDREFEHGENWIDPIVGLHGRYRFENGIFLTNLFQIGGFGAASDLTWDMFGGVGYQFNDSVSAVAGYRHLSVDYQDDGFVFDVDMAGPVIGMTIHF